MTKPRFFTDIRVGCVAVRDRMLTDPDYPGLHADTPGVVKFWYGTTTLGLWEVPNEHVGAAKALCAELNRNPPPEPTAEDVAEMRPGEDWHDYE